MKEATKKAIQILLTEIATADDELELEEKHGEFCGMLKALRCEETITKEEIDKLDENYAQALKLYWASIY